MDFPVFHLDWLGNRMLIAAVAVLHVLINHSMAVGAIPLVAAMEWLGYRTGDRRWDDHARRILGVCFIITTSLGALTGVGIWLSASLVNPAAIASLIRVFFWAWFTEWIVFVLEVCFILAYYLTWPAWTGPRKRRHLAMGAALAAFSWLTMAIITAILGFMMDSGVWPERRSLLSGIFNPLYLPQLLFRTPAAMVMAGLFAMFLTPFLLARRDPLRPRVVRFCGAWTLAWTGPLLAGAWAYWQAVPESLLASMPVALATQALEQRVRSIGYALLALAAVLPLAAAWGTFAPRTLPRVVLLLPFAAAVALIGTFERVREFVRKPDVIAGYMYANGVRRADYPLLVEQGLLRHATYVAARDPAADPHAAGREVFMLACTRCHTTSGVNGMTAKLAGLYGLKPWSPQAVAGFIDSMHHVRPFMPPFPGTLQERDALAAWLVSLQTSPERLPGAQRIGPIWPAPASGPASADIVPASPPRSGAAAAPLAALPAGRGKPLP